jgi:hypothetical protein
MRRTATRSSHLTVIALLAALVPGRHGAVDQEAPSVAVPPLHWLRLERVHGKPLEPARIEDEGAAPALLEAKENLEKTRGDAEEHTEPDDADAGADPDEADDTQDSTNAADGPADLDELISVLALDAAEAGEKGEDLFDELRKLREERSGPKRAEEARKLIEKTGSWMADDELDEQTGRVAVTVLERESRPDDPALADASNLHAEVAADLDGWGEKADSLVSKLGDVLETTSARKRSEKVDDLLEDLDKWIADDKLDATLGHQARAVLRAVPSS